MKDLNINSVVGYTRISSQSQSNNTSLSHQKQKIEEYCKLNDLELTKVYSEIDSGGKDDSEGEKIFEGSSEECYEFILKLMSTNSADYLNKFLNYINKTEYQ